MYLIGAFALKDALWHWLQRFGGLGLVAIGLIDNSVIPFPGGMDFFTILLAMTHRRPWWYYAMMATLGSVIGGYLTYRVGRKGGEETFEKKLSSNRSARIRRAFEGRGFLTTSLGCIAPPPIPIAPFFLAAGAMKYPLKRFFAAVVLGRSLRYLAVAYLASHYGKMVFHWLFRYYRPLLAVLIVMAVAGGVAALYYWKRGKHHPGDRAAGARSAHKVA